MFESGDLRCTTNEIVLSKLTSLSFLISKTVCVCVCLNVCGDACVSLISVIYFVLRYVLTWL